MNIGGFTWDNIGDHFYNTGIDGVALYVFNSATNWYGESIAWSGVTAINESPSGAESNKQYADNIEYLNLISKEEFGCTLECYQVPEAFDECDGIVAFGSAGSPALKAMKARGQARKSFGLVYRVLKGSDTVEAGGAVNASAGTDNAGSGKGYIYHIIYGCKAAPSSRDFGTVNDSPEAMTFSYEINCTDLTDASKIGPNLSDITHLCHIEIDSSKLTDDQYTALIEALYGTKVGTTYTPAAAMPTPAELYTACATT